MLGSVMEECVVPRQNADTTLELELAIKSEQKNEKRRTHRSVVPFSGKNQSKIMWQLMSQKKPRKETRKTGSVRRKKSGITFSKILPADTKLQLTFQLRRAKSLASLSWLRLNVPLKELQYRTTKKKSAMFTTFNIFRTPVLGGEAVVTLLYSGQINGSHLSSGYKLLIRRVQLEVKENSLIDDLFLYIGHKIAVMCSTHFLGRANTIVDAVPAHLTDKTWATVATSPRLNAPKALKGKDCVSLGKSVRTYCWLPGEMEDRNTRSILRDYHDRQPDNAWDLEALRLALGQTMPKFSNDKKTTPNKKDRVTSSRQSLGGALYVPDSEAYHNAVKILPVRHCETDGPLIVKIINFNSSPPSIVRTEVEWGCFMRQRTGKETKQCMIVVKLSSCLTVRVLYRWEEQQDYGIIVEQIQLVAEDYEESLNIEQLEGR